MTTLRSQKGFTLIELMTATFITVLFGAAFFAAFYAMRNELYQQNIFFSSNRGARFAMDMIARDAKEAIGIVASRGSDTTGNQVLIL
ncbi:MAG TPA: prepilin-type N-terminal cleavage/methylation domain-containing protein, partial [Candidatus Omnitrophota bacterium]|nr:prepilin-type N-terminal cleavage/methylation domain-containing protein [Candidatus Omnitrophota bacterium]